ncbi:MAG: class I SAM-dependent methyltransferase, partial [Anaerolineales bacterium]|nr:class I SAM-dependent methyltransferase [Anaerolineales bacterium]
MVQQTKSIENIQANNNGRVALPIVPQFLDDPLSGYALEMLRMKRGESLIDDVLLEMEELASIEQIPIIGPLEGAVIQILTQIRQPAPKLVLDIGTAIGYSALWLAKALPNGSQIISIEIDAQRAQTAKKFIEKAGYQHQIEVVCGDVLDLLPSMEIFDVILQDVIKHVYFGADSRLSLQLFEYCLDHLHDGGMLLGD